MSKKRLLLLFILLFFLLNTFSQVNYNIEQIFTVKVKQFNEFVKRFNYEIDLFGNPIDSAFEAKIDRSTYIASLFNQSDSRLKNLTSEYYNMQRNFIKMVADSNYIINKRLLYTKALAKSVILRNGNPDTLEIELIRESLGYGMYKWVINNVYDDSYIFQRSDTTGRVFLSPTSNETNFISLQRALLNKDQLLLYTKSNYGTDNLSFFIYEVYHGIVTFKNVIEMRYIISDIPGWEVEVKEFKRNTLNSGWLIDNLKQLE